jgi:hypothetical protein
MMTSIRQSILVGILAMACSSASAMPYKLHRHYRVRPARTVVVSRAVTVTHQKERLAMALAFLRSHNSLTVRQYAKLTGLSKSQAEAELDAFAMRHDNPIRLAKGSKNKVYVLR